jgi:hypothetical protein
LPATPIPPAESPAQPPAPQEIPEGVFAAVAAAVTAPVVRLEHEDRALRVMKRHWKDADVYLFFNESTMALHQSVTLMTDGRKAEVWNPQTATIASLKSKRVAGHVVIDLDLHPFEAQVVVVR